MDDLTQKTVRELFYYNPNTGILTNKIQRGSRGKVGIAAGSINMCGYLKLSINGKFYQNHRIIYLWWHGYTPKMIDHVDNIKTNNLIDNLRECTISQNGWNSKISSDNTSGVKGVTWHKGVKKWQAQIQFNKKSLYLGVFNNIELAELAVQNKRSEIHGEFCNHGEG